MDSNHVSLNLEMLSLQENRGRVAGGKEKEKSKSFCMISIHRCV